MIGTRFDNPLPAQDVERYAEAANWCNANHAWIVEHENYFEVEALPVPSFAELKAQKKEKIAAARYEAEIAGVTVNGLTIDTGRDSQALITGAAVAAMLDNEYSLNWKTASGFIHLTAPEIIAVAQAVRAHVQACFDCEAELVELVDAADTAEDLAAITWSM